MKNISTETENDLETRIAGCHYTISDMYPGLRLRWLKIYGKRRAHFFGEDSEITFSPLHIRLNSQLGLCIENPEKLQGPELENVISILKETFKEETVYNI